jgi:LPXTG-motif cell wall-anchored protein
MYRYNAQGEKLRPEPMPQENYEQLPMPRAMGMDTDEDKAKWAAIIIVIVVVLGGGGYILWKKSNNEDLFGSSSSSSGSSTAGMAFRFY